VAVIGAGPAGFFVAEQLLSREGVHVEVDMYERLPAPFGLVRFGVAPDHEKIKNVSRSFEKTGGKPNFRFFGNVEIGKHLSLADLRQHYHQICFTTGAQTDRRIGIPGEDLERSHTATEFVAWYNAHPDYRDCEFDLSVERVAIIGVGNVAVDVARILCRTPEELAQTDIADHALEALRRSRVKEVYMLGRRGPAQAAFTTAEVRELGELPGADTVTVPEEVELDPLSEEWAEREDSRTLQKKLEVLREMAQRPPTGKPRRLTIRFLRSPVELIGNSAHKVVGMRLVKNVLVPGEDGRIVANPTDVTEELPVELVFRSVGYRGIPIPGLPFDDRRGIVPNQLGRVVQPETGEPLSGVYVSGWIKRGPTGVIGTNKPDAAETVTAMLEDVSAGAVPTSQNADPVAVLDLVRQRQPDYISFADWRRIDAAETQRGKAQGRPRVKFTTVEEMLEVARRGAEAD
jgi:ferredoxin--NADP+ reductase